MGDGRLSGARDSELRSGPYLGFGWNRWIHGTLSQELDVADGASL